VLREVGRKADNKMSSPSGRVPIRVEGQVNTPIITPIRERSIPPINHLYQGDI